MSTRIPLTPVSCVDQIREIDRALEDVLEGLHLDDWERPAVKTWRVRDVASHLLDTNLRRLSLDRDAHRPQGSPPPDESGSFEAWVAFLDRLNAEWTKAAQRLSPSVILELLRATNVQVADYFESLDPGAPATFGVRWAKPSESKVWLDVAREYTEKWHHQAQIRDAVGQPGLEGPHLILPLIETLLRGVPRAYESIEADTGTSVLIAARDLDGGRWLLRRDEGEWNLYPGFTDATASATIVMSSASMWRVLMKQISRDDARADSEVTGAPACITPFFDAVSVMA